MTPGLAYGSRAVGIKRIKPNIVSWHFGESRSS
jgi:hypothetical protein